MSGLDVAQCTGKVVASRAVSAAMDGAMIVASDPNFITDVALEGVKESSGEVAKVKGLQALQYLFEPIKDSPIATAGGLVVVFEGVPFALESLEASYRLCYGAIGVRDFAVNVSKSGTKAVCCGAGSLLGASIGQAIIPVPFLGAVVGGTVGNFLGKCTARGIPFP